MEFDAEIVCECGCRFKCPRCGVTPQLRLVSSGLLDRCGQTEEASLVDEAELCDHRFAQRGEPKDDRAHWICVEDAAKLIGISRKSLAILGPQLAAHVRRRRNGHSFVWYKPDLEAIAQIREECGHGFDGALRTYAALIERRL
jgi:hypothetical protein